MRKGENCKANTIKLTKGDGLYLFFDGLLNQFCYLEQNKFGLNAIREAIMLQNEKDMTKIGRFLTTTYKKWKGNCSQIDDILLMGGKL